MPHCPQYSWHKLRPPPYARGQTQLAFHRHRIANFLFFNLAVLAWRMLIRLRHRRLAQHFFAHSLTLGLSENRHFLLITAALGIELKRI